MTQDGRIFDAPAARLVLEDCREALRQLQENQRGPQWRIAWVAALALLRTVRNVLAAVDLQDPVVRPEMQNAIRQFLNTTAEDDAHPAGEFHDRANRILHMYRIDAAQRVELVQPDGIVVMTVATSATTKSVSSADAIDAYLLATYPINGGPFDGRHQREMLREAIECGKRQ
jgi:hypothetical protein